MNVKLAIQLVRNMGWRYATFRLRHEAEKKLGLLRQRHPVFPAKQTFITLEHWREFAPAFFFEDRSALPRRPAPEALEALVNRILDGELCFFGGDWLRLGTSYDWHTHPLTGKRFPAQKHWSDIPDFSAEFGDIKYVWEKSRFSYLLPVLRHDLSSGTDHSAFVLSEIESWIQANPVNQGPNWRCSQEISLRVLNWCFALYFYRNSENLTEQRWAAIQHAIFWQLHHVYTHISFSRIAVRNNHAITETLMLAVSELLFPFIPETKKWAADGRRWFEEEIERQIYDDGTYLQFSMNYHRVVIQLLTAGIRLGEIHAQPFSDTVYERAYASLNFLYQCQQPNGWLPDYGANDGALFFPFSLAEHRDFRPQLSALHEVLTGKALYHEHDFDDEDHWWWGSTGRERFPVLQHREGCQHFPDGGYLLIRDAPTFTFMRCGRHNDRPSQADNLHLDLWHGTENVLRDNGSYQYNTDPMLQHYFMGTQSHNTVMIDGADQMLKGARFMWFYWSQAEDVQLTETADYYEISGCIKAFQHRFPGLKHRRTVRKLKGKPHWVVMDFIESPHKFREALQLWHSDHRMLAHIEPEGEFRLETTSAQHAPGYGRKEPSILRRIAFTETLTTHIRIQ